MIDRCQGCGRDDHDAIIIREIEADVRHWLPDPKDPNWRAAIRQACSEQHHRSHHEEEAKLRALLIEARASLEKGIAESLKASDRIAALESLLRDCQASLVRIAKAIEVDDDSQAGEAIVWLERKIAKALP